AADHITVLDEAIAQLPKEVRAGHGAGDDASLVGRQVICRTDSAGTTAAFLSALRARNVGFFTSAITNTQIQAAILDAIGIEGAWVPAVTQDGEERPGTAVCELTSLVELSSFPSGTRLIVRREPLHPGAQRSLFPSLEHRYWGFYTDQEGDPVSLDVTMRAHAHVENHICRLKDSGLLAFPFTSFEANKNWMAVVMLAADLVRWFQLLCLDGYFASARPKALRWAILHAPGRIVRSGRQVIVRLLANWPDAGAILRAYRHIEALT
ncbi:MAG: transposase, partial [Acidimicrobiales bacterium]